MKLICISKIALFLGAIISKREWNVRDILALKGCGLATKAMRWTFFPKFSFSRVSEIAVFQISKYFGNISSLPNSFQP